MNHVEKEPGHEILPRRTIKSNAIISMMKRCIIICNHHRDCLRNTVNLQEERNALEAMDGRNCSSARLKLIGTTEHSKNDLPQRIKRHHDMSAHQ